MDNLEQRVAELERGMRRWRRTAGVLALGMAGAYVLAAGPAGQTPATPPRSGIGGQPRQPVQPPPATTPTPPPPATPTTAPEMPSIRAKSVELVNEAGKVVARLTANDFGGRIEFLNTDGKVVARGGADPDGGSGFGAFDDADNPSADATISVRKGEADVVAEDKHGSTQLSTGPAPGEAGDTPRGVSIFEHGRPVWESTPRRGR